MRTTTTCTLGLALLLSAPLLACSSSDGAPGPNEPGGGVSPGLAGLGAQSGADGGGAAGSLGAVPEGGAATGSGGGVPSALTAIVRDFRLYNAGDPTTNANFENVPSGGDGPWDDRGIVASTLGTDGKPVYAHAGTTLTTHGPTSFADWYNDTAGTNLHVEVPIALTDDADGTRSYDSQVSGVPLSSSDPTKMFFPIDDGTKYATAFGDQGDPHNYSFTVEIHTRFTYRGGEFFRFRGDDDVWVFIDGKLAIDLGGVHPPEEQTVQVDTLGLTKGTEYPLDFFFAERHKTGSNVLFETSLDIRPAPPPK
jgi:fibro-slime domain-containing protein